MDERHEEVWESSRHSLSGLYDCSRICDTLRSFLGSRFGWLDIFDLRGNDSVTLATPCWHALTVLLGSSMVTWFN